MFRMIPRHKTTIQLLALALVMFGTYRIVRANICQPDIINLCSNGGTSVTMDWEGTDSSYNPFSGYYTAGDTIHMFISTDNENFTEYTTFSAPDETATFDLPSTGVTYYIYLKVADASDPNYLSTPSPTVSISI